MINEALYNKTVDILVQAYFNDSLEHCNCRACAVGNIVAANMGIELVVKPKPFGMMSKVLPKGFSKETVGKCDLDSGVWFGAISAGMVRRGMIDEGVAKQVTSTGYTAYELCEIEKAFEHAPSKGDWMFNGLMAVVDALDQIHENTDAGISQSAKQRFNKAVKLEVCDATMPKKE